MELMWKKSNPSGWALDIHGMQSNQHLRLFLERVYYGSVKKMRKAETLVKNCLLLQLLILIFLTTTVQAEGVQARYVENSGKRSVLEIIIEDPAPSSVIVKQYLPAGKSMESTLPAYTKYNAKKKMLTWLFKRPVPGVIQVITYYTSPLTGEGASAVIRCKNPRDGTLMTIHVQ